MPIFEFTCRACGQVFEDILTFAELETGEARCPNCESHDVQRAMSTFATNGGEGGGLAGGCGSGGFG